MTTQIIGAITTVAENTDTGILFYEDEGKIYILDIYPASPFASTDLQPGMQVVSINNNLCEGVTVEFVTNMLKVMGTITILAQHDSPIITPLANSTSSAQSVTASISPSQPSAPAIESFSEDREVDLATVVEYPLVQAELVNESYPQNTVTVLPDSVILAQQQQTQTHVQPHRSQTVPPGVQEGGVWGSIRVVGGKTCIIWLASFFTGCWPCLFICFCPVDTKRAYRVSDRVYDKYGKYIGSTRSTNFVPSRSENIISNW